MGIAKTLWGLVGVSALGIGAFEAVHVLPGYLSQSAVPTASKNPVVQTVRWLPHHRLNRPHGPSTTSVPSVSSGQNPWATSQSSLPLEANSLNWAGIVQEGNSERSVQATWTAPSFNRPAHNNSSIAEWVGLGGMQSSALIQVGTITTPNSQGQATTVAFWEKLPQPAVQSVTIPTGASVTAKIEPVAVDSWRLTLTVQGQSSPVVDKLVTLSPTKAASVQTSADWITEAPTTNHGVAPLAPVASTKMSNVEANGVSLSQMNPSTLESIGLFNQTGQLIAEPVSESANAITVDTVYGANANDGSNGLPSSQLPGSGGYGNSQGGYGYGYNSGGYGYGQGGYGAGRGGYGYGQGGYGAGRGGYGYGYNSGGYGYGESSNNGPFSISINPQGGSWGFSWSISY